MLEIITEHMTRSCVKLKKLFNCVRIVCNSSSMCSAHVAGFMHMEAMISVHFAESFSRHKVLFARKMPPQFKIHRSRMTCTSFNSALGLASLFHRAPSKETVFQFEHVPEILSLIELPIKTIFGMRATEHWARIRCP